MNETMTDIREKAYREMFDFINWFAEKDRNRWKELCEQYAKEAVKE